MLKKLLDLIGLAPDSSLPQTTQADRDQLRKILSDQGFTRTNRRPAAEEFFGTTYDPELFFCQTFGHFEKINSEKGYGFFISIIRLGSSRDQERFVVGQRLEMPGAEKSGVPNGIKTFSIAEIVTGIGNNTLEDFFFNPDLNNVTFGGRPSQPVVDAGPL
jgi:hypothetical protein